MAVTAGWYGEALRGQWSATAARRQDFVTGDPLKCSLHTSSYTIDNDAHDFWNDATNELPASGNYATGGVTLGSRALTIVGGSNQIQFDAADAAWVNVTWTGARRAVNYFDTAGASSTDPLYSWVDFGGDETVSAANFTIQWDSTGIATITYT